MSSHEAETERLFLERLSLEKHLKDFHELWNNDMAVLWSYVLCPPLLSSHYINEPGKEQAKKRDSRREQGVDGKGDFADGGELGGR